MQLRSWTLPVFLAGSLAWPSPGGAQAVASGSGNQRQRGQFAGDALARYETTRDIPGDEGATRDESRWRVQLRPRYRMSFGSLELGVGGAFNHSRDRNDEPAVGETDLGIVRDNYRSRDARLDLAYGRLRLGVLEIQGGRFVMPFALTEMLWDADLRPQGGAVSLSFSGTSSARLALRGLYSIGSHVYDDESSAFGGAAELTLKGATNSQLQIVGAYLQFRDLDRLNSVLHRQNTIVAGHLSEDYRVADAVVRITTDGPLTLVGDYCWNTAVGSNNRGLWLSATLGALDLTRATLEYTYARIDKDATVGAFNADDFYWSTGWEGHRIDTATGTAKGGSVHVITQWQRPKGTDASPSAGWVKRWRLEWRGSF